MEGSIASRNQLPRGTQVFSPVHAAEGNARRPLRQMAVASTPFNEVLVTLWQWKWLILAGAIAGGLLTGLAGLARAPVFEATTQLIIRTPAASGAPETPPTQDALTSRIDDHITGISSPAHLRRVLAALSELDRRPPSETTNTPAAESPVAPGLTAKAREKLGPIVRGVLKAFLPTSDVAMRVPEDTQVKTLSRNLRVGQELRSRILGIGYSDPDPNRAALVANLIAEVYIQDLAQKNSVSDQRDLDSVIARLPAVRDELLSATDELERYRMTHGAADPGAMDSNSKEIAELSKEISLAAREVDNAETRLSKVRELQSQGAPVAAVAEAMGNPGLTDLLNSRTHANDDFKGGAIGEEVERGIANIEARLNAYRAQLASLNERKEGLGAVAADAASRVAGLRALEPRVATATQQHNTLLSRQQELMRRIADPDPGIEILSAAWPPAFATTLSPVFLIPPGIVLFGMLTAIILVVRTRFDTTIRGEVQAEEALGVPCLGLLPAISKPRPATLRRLLLGRPCGAYSRAMLSLLFAVSPVQAKGRPSGVILLTSTLIDDGKTATAWGLALSASRLAGKVLFLDLGEPDARLTSAFRERFSISKASNGFADYLRGRCKAPDAVEEMPEIGVSFMAGSTDQVDLLPLLSCLDSAELFNDLRTSYDFVVMVGPSGRDGPEAMLLARWADAVLFAVRWGKTKSNMTRIALAQLGTDGSPPANVSSVLTQVNLTKHVSYRFKDSGDLLRAAGS
jgi:uncharacterized protein involved in exopolysaccharide biosynthesis/Mrp family chromosome partitioning ATPase